MGRAPCCEKDSVKRGPWTPEEDAKLLACISQYGTGSWRTLPKKAGLQRCGKSCRLRWTNYLRPDLKHGRFSEQEEQLIVKLHAALGSRWSLIAAQLPGRTDNDVKNYWNTRLKKKLCEMGIDPITHKPISQLLADLAGSMANNNTSRLENMAGGTMASYGGDITEATLGCFKDDMLNVLMRKRSMGQPITANNSDNNNKSPSIFSKNNPNYMNNNNNNTSTFSYGLNPSESPALDHSPNPENPNSREDFPIRKPSSIFSSGAYFSSPSGPVSGVRSASARMRTQSIFNFCPTIPAKTAAIFGDALPAKTSAIFSGALQDCSLINPVSATANSAIDPTSPAPSPPQRYHFSPAICNNNGNSAEDYQNNYENKDYQINYTNNQFFPDLYNTFNVDMASSAQYNSNNSYLNYLNPGLNYDCQSLITHQISQLGPNSINYSHGNVDENPNEDNNYGSVPDLNLASAANQSVFFTALLRQQEETLCNTNPKPNDGITETGSMEISPFSAPSRNNSNVNALVNYGLINSSRYYFNYDSVAANYNRTEPNNNRTKYNYDKTEHNYSRTEPNFNRTELNYDETELNYNRTGPNIWSPATNSGSSSSSNLLNFHHLGTNNSNCNLIPAAGHNHINHNLISATHNQLDGVLNMGSSTGPDSTSGLLWDFSELGSMVT